VIFEERLALRIIQLWLRLLCTIKPVTNQHVDSISERDEQPEKEEDTVKERAKRSRTSSRTGARGVERIGSFTLDARSSPSHLGETIPVAIPCFWRVNSAHTALFSSFRP
jgi:hypothetical protein